MNCTWQTGIQDCHCLQTPSDRQTFQVQAVFNANIFLLFIINSFSGVKRNLICLNCHWVSINPLHALIKFQKDLTRYKISHLWPDLATQQKFNNKRSLSGLIPGCLWHRDKILVFCITKSRTFIPAEVVEESFSISLQKCLISEPEFVDKHCPKHDSWKW